MLDERCLANLIGLTYDAAIGDEDWAVAVDRLTRAVSGGSAALRWHGTQAHDAVAVDCDPDFIQRYAAHYRDVDPVWPMMRRLPFGSAVDDRMLVSERELERSEFYNDFLAPYGLYSALSWYGKDHAARPVVLTVMRSRRQPSYGDDELRLLRRLAPHLDRAVAIEGRIATAAARRTAVRLAQARPALSRRERECLARIARGASNKAIARQLDLSVQTINQYVQSAMRKLGAANRTEAVAIALTLGLLDG